MYDVNLEVDAGQVYGFLGPNGAGKTTTIRMLMDLIRPTEGKVHLFGSDVQKSGDIFKRIGALVEGAAFYEYMSGRDNLTVFARPAGGVDSQRIDFLLDQVGLTKRAESAVKSYSLGMKQRLGIAAALLGNPELVILDEPTNGLDPAGIQEVRSFIRTLATEAGKTVFLSSHLLNEVEQICDRVAIINAGEIVREGSVDELLAEGKTDLRIQATPLERAAQILNSHWSFEKEADWLVLNSNAAESWKVVRTLVQADIEVHQLIVRRQSLEDYFMAVTGEDGRQI